MATFWRVHPGDRPFGPTDATSKPFYNHDDAEPQQGYSCFENPWHLYLYVLVQWAGLYDGTTVLSFPGNRVGTGHDGEALAVPTGLPRKTDWGQFCEDLPSHPLPPSPKFASWMPHWFQSWDTLAKRWAYLDQELPEQEFIVRKFGYEPGHPRLGSKTAGANGDLPADLRIEWFVGQSNKGRPMPGYTTGYAYSGSRGVGIITYVSEPVDNLAVGEIFNIVTSPDHQRRGVATWMFDQARKREPLLHHSDALTDDGRAWSQKTASLPSGYTIEVQEQERTDRWGLPNMDVRVKYEGRTVGSLSVFQRLYEGDARPVGHPNIYVDEEHQRRGLATAMYAEVQRRWPHVPIVHSEHASDAAKALNRTLPRYARQQFALPPKSDGPILRNWKGYSQESQQRILATYDDLMAGRIRPEPKQRPPLVGFWTAQISGADRIIVDDLPGGGWVLLGAVFEHNYELAERQIAGWLAWRQRTASGPLTIYRAEHRPPDADLSQPESIGVHWTTRAIDYGYQHEPGWKRVVWQATVEPEAIEDSSDRFNEGEVVVRNGAVVHLTGRTERMKGPYVDVQAGQPEHPMNLDVTVKGTRIASKTATTYIPMSTEDLSRQIAPVRKVARPLSLDEATTLTRRVLGAAGFPQADQAVAERHPSGFGMSSVAWYMDTIPPIPVVALAQDMQNELTVLHECAHILRNGPGAAGKNSAQLGYAVHDPEFFRVFLRLMRQYASPECLKRFETIFGTRDFMAAKTAAGAGRWFHIADKADFRLNPKKEPALNRTLPTTLKPGIFLTQDPQRWGGDYGYRRPFIVEFDVPAEAVNGGIEGSNELYVPAEFYDRLRIVKVHTWDGFIRDQWRSEGPVEGMTGIDHVTGEPLVVTGRQPMSMDPAYAYPGPGVDARQIPADRLRQYVTDFKKWRRTQPKGFMVSSLTSTAARPTYLHGTWRPLSPGDVLEPGHGQGSPGVSRKDVVYVTTLLGEARIYAGAGYRRARIWPGAGAYVYEVEPEGEVLPDPYLNNGTAFITPRAKVVRMVENLAPKGASLTKTADEDQCPYCAGDSLMTEWGEYLCESGHYWVPSDPAAQAYHGDGPERGVIQPTASVPGLVIEEEWDLPSIGPGQRAVSARINGKLVGGLLWTVADGIIDYIQVDADQRRQGIATALLEAARRLDPNVKHDVEENRSDLGKAWVRAVGSKTAAAPRDMVGDSKGTRTLYRGEGDYTREPYDRGTAGHWWTSDRRQAEDYAKKTTNGRVYEIEVNEGEYEPRGLPGYFLVPRAEVRERRRLVSSKTATQPGVYYHVTSYRNWPEIRTQGLRPGSDGHVWLFTEMDAAMRFKDAWGGSDWSTTSPTEWKVPPCIIVVRTDRAVPTEAGVPGAYWVEGEVTEAEVFDVVRPADLHHYASRRTAALPTGLYWRTHDQGRPFGPEDATSQKLTTSFDDSDRVLRGYSCLEDPWDLWVYILAFGWMKTFIANDEVVAFTGKRQRLRGTDGEPLVIPDMQTVRRFSWPEFERLLLETPRPAKPGGPGARHGYYDNWYSVGNAAISFKDRSPVAAELWSETAEWAGVKTAFRMHSHVIDVVDRYVHYIEKGYDDDTARTYAAHHQMSAKAERYAPERAKALIQQVMDDYGQGKRIFAILFEADLGDDFMDAGSYSMTQGRNHIFRIKTRNAFTILHECAHAVAGMEAGHGQQFRIVFRDMLRKYARNGEAAGNEFFNNLYVLGNEIKKGTHLKEPRNPHLW